MFNSTDECFIALSKSKFRSSFHLKTRDILHAKNLGIDKISSHIDHFIDTRLNNNKGIIDGKQTPYKGHPVFIAQHATATCCRGCIKKWHGIDENRELTLKEKEYIKTIILSWIKRELYS